MEFTNEAVTKPLIITLPMPDGTFARFSAVESPVTDPALGHKFPEIRTYLARGIDDPAASVRLNAPESPRLKCWEREGRAAREIAAATKPIANCTRVVA